jgi:hypothetical protein
MFRENEEDYYYCSSSSSSSRYVLISIDKRKGVYTDKSSRKLLILVLAQLPELMEVCSDAITTI